MNIKRKNGTYTFWEGFSNLNMVLYLDDLTRNPEIGLNLNTCSAGTLYVILEKHIKNKK
jgi:hypothetical protein